MKRNGSAFVSRVGGLLLAAVAVSAPMRAWAQEVEQAPPSSKEDLILRELEELRKEIQALRSEVGELRGAVADIHKVAVRPPAPPAPSTVQLDDDAVMGSADAKVAIMEFSDYQCPYCRRFHDQTFPQIKENYIETGKVRYIFRDFPLEQLHPKAFQASIAANCAGKQDRYWDMHHALFANQPRLGPELYTELAQTLGLDADAFKSCLEDPTQAEEIQKDLAYGQGVGIRGTPHYFVGRIEGDRLVDVKAVSGAQPFPAFAKLIDSLLQPQQQ